MIAAILAFLALVAVLGFGSGWLIRKLDKPTPWPDGAEEALRALWCDFLGLPWATRPRVFWFRGKQLNCSEGTGFRDVTGKCVAGNTRYMERVVNLAYVEGSRLSDGAMAHEVCGHYWLGLRGSPTYRGHSDPVFQAGGQVDQGREFLRQWEKGRAA